MPTTTNSTKRKMLSDLVKGYDKFQDEAGINLCFTTVNVKGSGDVDCIGTLLEWNDTNSAFYPVTSNTAWEAEKAYTAGDVVVPLASYNGFAYVATNSDTSHTAEPTWPTYVGGTVTETGDQAWRCIELYPTDVTSPLPNSASVCVTVGNSKGRGFNEADVTLSASAQKMTVLYRGPAAVSPTGMEVSGIDTDDLASFKKALEASNIAIADDATVVVSSTVSA